MLPSYRCMSEVFRSMWDGFKESKKFIKLQMIYTELNIIIRSAIIWSHFGYEKWLSSVTDGTGTK